MSQRPPLGLTARRVIAIAILIVGALLVRMVVVYLRT